MRRLFTSLLTAGLKKLQNRTRPLPSIRKTLHCRRFAPQVEALEDRWLPSADLTVGANINVSKTNIGEAENAIAINPTNSLNLFATSTTGALQASSGGLPAAYSKDGGATWKKSNLSNLPQSGGKVQLAWDQFGNLFMSYIQFVFGPVATTVALSKDGGENFSVIFNSGNDTEHPSIATGAGMVWISYSPVVAGSLVAVNACGAKVTGLGAVGSFSSPEKPAGSTGAKGDIAIGPTGQVMLVYQELNANDKPSNLYYTVDPDGLGPKGLSASALITRTNVGTKDLIPAAPSRGIDAEANLAWDRSNGSHKGRVYMVYVDETVDENSDADVLVRHSDNAGKTWSLPVRVNDDSVGNGKSQFQPAIAVDQTNGDVAVTWYDCRNSTTNKTTQVFASVSRDGGLTWLPSVKISAGTIDATTSQAGSYNYGEYDKMDFHNRVFFRAWADNSNSTGDNPAGAGNSMDLYTASVNVAPANNGTGGSDGGGPADSGNLSPVLRLYNPVRYSKNRLTNTFDGLLTLQNKGAQPLTGPVYIIFAKLPANISLANAMGMTAGGKPFIKIDVNLAKGKVTRALLRLNNPGLQKLPAFYITTGITLSSTSL